MSLQRKAATVLGLTFLGLTVVLYLVSSHLLLGSFATLEDRDTRLQTQRVVSALEASLATLNDKAGDWANWDDAYAYVARPNARFIAKNATDKSFSEIRINVLAFVHTSGRIVYLRAFDLAAEHGVPVPEGIRDHLGPASPLTKHPNPQSILTGILPLRAGPLLFASRPIVNSQGKGPIRGTLIFARFLDDAEVAKLSALAKLPVRAYRLDEPQTPPEIRAAASQSTTDGTVAVRRLDGETIAGYATLLDAYGKPAVALEVSMPRAVHARGQASVRHLLTVLIVVGVVFGGVTLLLLNRTVVSPLMRLRAGLGTAEPLATSPDESGPAVARDEVASLAGAVQGIQSALARSREGQRTSEERYRRLVENVPDVIYRCRIAPSRSMEYVSPRVVEMTGYQPEAFYADPDFIRTIICAEERAAVSATVQAGLEAGHPYQVTYRITTAGGGGAVGLGAGTRRPGRRSGRGGGVRRVHLGHHGAQAGRGPGAEP